MWMSWVKCGTHGELADGAVVVGASATICYRANGYNLHCKPYTV